MQIAPLTFMRAAVAEHMCSKPTGVGPSGCESAPR